MVQKHEAEIRNHVRTEQQLRLYIENIENDNEAKFAASEKELAKLKLDNKMLLDKMARQSKELTSLRSGSKEKLMSRIPIEEVRNSVPTNMASTLNSTQNTMVSLF